MQSIQPQGCTPLRPSYVADLRGHNLKGNTTLAPADNNTTRKAGPCCWQLRSVSLPFHGSVPPKGQSLPSNQSAGWDQNHYEHSIAKSDAGSFPKVAGYV